MLVVCCCGSCSTIRRAISSARRPASSGVKPVEKEELATAIVGQQRRRRQGKDRKADFIVVLYWRGKLETTPAQPCRAPDRRQQHALLRKSDGVLFFSLLRKMSGEKDHLAIFLV